MSSGENQTDRFLTISHVIQQVIQKQDELFSKEVLTTMESVLSTKNEVLPEAVIAEVLKLADPSVMNQILDSLTQDNPELAKKVKEKLFFIEDLVRLDDLSVQKMLRETDSMDLSEALKGVSRKVQDKIFKNMSERAVELIKEDMEYMGPVPASDVRIAQLALEKTVMRLQAMGQIEIVSSSSKNDLTS